MNVICKNLIVKLDSSDIFKYKDVIIKSNCKQRFEIKLVARSNDKTNLLVEHLDSKSQLYLSKCYDFFDFSSSKNKFIINRLVKSAIKKWYSISKESNDFFNFFNVGKPIN